MRGRISWLLLGVLLAVPVVGPAAVASAADLCLTFEHEFLTYTFVVLDAGGGKDGKNMSKDLGKANKCKQTTGFFTQGLLTGSVVGVSFCTTHDSSTVTLSGNNGAFSFVASFPPSPLPNDAGFILGTGWFTTVMPSVPLSVGVCVPSEGTPVPHLL